MTHPIARHALALVPVLQAALLGLALVLLLSPVDRTPGLTSAFHAALLAQCGWTTWRLHRRRLLGLMPQALAQSLLASQAPVTDGWLERTAITVAVITFVTLALA